MHDDPLLVLATLGSSPAHALDLSVPWLAPGQLSTYVATDAIPGATVLFVFGSEASTECADGAPSCVRPGVELGTATADEHGVAVLARPLHERAPVGEFVFQAIVRGGPASAVVRARIHASSPTLLAAVRP